MKIVLVVLINIIFSLIQTSFFSNLVGSVFVPNIVFIFAFSLMFWDLKKLSLMSAFVGGLFLDLLGFNIVGLSSLIMVGSLNLFFIVRRHFSKGWVVNLLFFSLSLVLYDYILGNLVNIGLKEYTGFILAMVVIAVFFIMVIKRFLNYLHKIGIDLNKD